MILIDGLVK